MASYHLGIDVGGTFTDAVLIDTATGATRRGKVQSTPEDQSIGVVRAIEQFGVPLEEVEVFGHGHTVAINALLQRGGAKTGLICTEGTRDVLDMGRLRRPFGEELYDASWHRPHQARPLVHRRYIRDIPERLRYDGATHVALDEDAVRDEVDFLRREGVESIAVCLLHSYANPAHEQRVIEIIHDAFPDVYVVSSAVRPVVGEYDRTCTVVLNAYTGPIITRYLKRLRDQLAAQGYGDDVLVMQMNGGVRTLDRTIEEFPAYTIQSGPVAGLLGAEAYARQIGGAGNLICMDVGGTSTDVGVVVEGEAQRTDDWEVEFGIRLGFPSIDVRSIGAGGGSLIQIDELGTLRIGPESAGAEPGPAAYQRGGTKPTVTDALVVMGVIQPGLFLGGGMKLSREAAETALRTVSDPLAMSAEELAFGVFQLAGSHMEAEISKMAFERALDVTKFGLLAYGGAGPIFGASVAASLGVPDVHVPYFPGGFSALGMVTAPLRVERSRALVEDIDAVGHERLQALFDELESEIRADLERQAVPAKGIEVERVMYGLYSGQTFANRVPLRGWPITDEAVAGWKQDVHEYYEKVYGYSALESPIVVTTLTVVGSGPAGHLPMVEVQAGGERPPDDAVVARELASLDGSRAREVSFFDRPKLLARNRIEGPAIIDDGLATIVVPPASVAVVDPYGNIQIRVG